MDPAFLRRPPYELEAGAPEEQTVREIFDKVAFEKGLKLTDELFSPDFARVAGDFAPRMVVAERARD